MFVRWENLSVEKQEGETSNLPGFRDPAVVRRFDVPEAMGIRFHEINARSAINEVPKASRMPFRHTINPYRGCTHACLYCLQGDTPILMADGRTRLLEELRPGDKVYGTVRDRSYRRYAITEVVDHWTTKKHAYRVTLEDGTELVASGDHRFLTNRGWKHVADAPDQRPHLTLNNEMMGFGALPPAPPEFAPDYRKRTFAGTALKSDAKLGVVSIESLPGKRLLYDITTGTGDFIANGIVSHNCFARPTHTYLDFNARQDFEREIVVKVNVPELVRKELAKPSWGGDHVALGTNTDPYQWVEGRYRLMRGIWEAMRDYANPCSVLTKSPLLTRDLDLMLEIRERTDFTAALSIPTLEESAWRATEPHTPHPRKRIDAVAELNAAGIPTGVLIGPMIPGVNDHPEQVRELVDLCAEAGATHVTPIPLHLRGEVKEIWFDWLEVEPAGDARALSGALRPWRLHEEGGVAASGRAGEAHA